MTEKRQKPEVISNVPPEAREAARRAKHDLEVRDATPTEPPLSAQDQQQAERQQVHQLIVQKLDRLLRDLGGHQCPHCGSRRRFVHEPIQFATGGPDEPQNVIPPFSPMPTMLPHSCRRCGNVRWVALNAVLQAPAEGDAPRRIAGSGIDPIPDPE